MSAVVLLPMALSRHQHVVGLGIVQKCLPRRFRISRALQWRLQVRGPSSTTARVHRYLSHIPVLRQGCGVK